ncbi:MAG: hypothetical protein G01um101413_936 [Parcubacteria group bacterium Gr01-1014_13]|nr:MAG: hypothetical protein G01um101413_936 [Parcubacteria group bacterium Gr01-1014_13]
MFKLSKVKNTPRLNNAGSTLLEAVVSLAIIAIFFILFQAAATTAILNRNVKHQELALRIAQSRIENLRALGYAALPSSGPFTDAQLTFLPEAAASTTVSQYNTKTKQVSVEVSWQEPGAQKRHNVSLTTLIGEGGL